MAGRLTRGEIYLAHFPPPDKQRPVIILTRDSALSVLTKVTVVPITSTVRGAPSEMPLDVDDGLKGPCVANFFHLSTIRQSGLIRYVSTLSEARMEQLCAFMRYALGCD